MWRWLAKLLALLGIRHTVTVTRTTGAHVTITKE